MKAKLCTSVLAALACLTGISAGADSILVINPSFQADNFSAFPGYRGGSNPGTITGWTATGGAGINGSDLGAGTPFADNGAIPDGTRLAFIQGTGSLAQTLNGFEVGKRYWIQVFVNARNCCGDVPVVSVSIGGNTLLSEQTLTPVGATNPYYFANLPWSATATSASLLISTHANAGGDASLVLDAVAVIKRDADQVLIANPSFEASGSNIAVPGYITAIAGWTISGTGGTAINSAGGAFLDNGIIPDGANILVLQNAISAQQTLAGLTPGQSYHLRLFYNARSSTSVPRFRAAIGTQIALDTTVQPVGPGQPFRELSFDFVASSSTAPVILENVGESPDSSVLVDNVSLTAFGPAVANVPAPPAPADPGGAGGVVTFNEIQYNPVGTAPEWIELYNSMAVRVDLGGWRLEGGIAFTFPEGTTLEPGGYLVVSAVAGNPAGALGPFTGKLDGSGDTIRLVTHNGVLVDRIAYGVSGDWPTAADGTGLTLAKRSPDYASDPAASWTASAQAGGTPGAANFSSPPPLAAPTSHVAGPVVINELLYHQRPRYEDPFNNVTFAEDPTEWIELYNRTAAPVDLSGWRLSDAISYTFPPGTNIPGGGFLVINQTQFNGSLANSGETVRLRDASGALVDKVHYRDGGRWSEYAAGRGASLELIDPNADNTKPEAWASSDESAKMPWQTITYRTLGAEPPGSNNPATWHEFLLGFLDAGEALIDDVSVIEDPDGAAVQLIQNGTFDNDTIGKLPQKWRILGTHNRSVVVQDPDGPGKVLKLIATGEMEHTYNCASTTLAGNRPIDPVKTYEIRFRAKWIAGSPQLNSRLYLNRAARTTILAQPAVAGTPGAPNSRRLANAGPTYEQFGHAPAVPAVNQPVTVSVIPQDPDGLAEMMLFYSVNESGWQQVPMSDDGNGRFRGEIPGQLISNAVVQFYIRGTDARGAQSFFPSGGPDSRALFRIGDGGVAAQPVRNKLRLVMTRSDANLLHNPVHGVSNARLWATAIYNDREVFYNVAVRLRSAPYGRQGNRAGWNIEFDPEQPFRGIERSIVIDGALNMPKGDGTGWIETTTGVSINEMLYLKTAERAGGIAAEHDDIIYFAAPRLADNRRAQLRLKRYNDDFLDEFVPNGSSGALFKQELIYYPTNTVDGNPESLKNPYNAVTEVDIKSLGPAKDSYRFTYLVRNRRARDDFSRIIAMGQAFSQPNASLYSASAGVIDFDNWMRVLAMNALFGVADTYNMGLAHNIQFFVRPSDQRVMLMPWDLDHAFYYATNSSIFGGGQHRVRDLINDPRNRRLFGGHLLDLINTAFSNQYLDPWIDHYNGIAGQSYAQNFKNWVGARRSYVQSQLNTYFPLTAFAITSNNGADFTTTAPSTVLAGNGWIDVHEIRNAATGAPYTVTWLSGSQWQITVPLLAGQNTIALQAVSHQGKVVGTDSITITNTGPLEPASAVNLVVSELMYHPGALTAAEQAAGFTIEDDFEFIELQNIGSATVDLTGAQFTTGITFSFTGSAITSLAPGARVLVVRNAAAFASRYGAGFPVAGVYSGALDNSGERIVLQDRGGLPIVDFTYGDGGAWPEEADGGGYSLTLIRPGSRPDPASPASWRPSTLPGGSPNSSDVLSASSFANLLDYALTAPPIAVMEKGSAIVFWHERVGAEEARIIPQLSDNLTSWQADPGDKSLFEFVSASTDGNGSRTVRYRLTRPFNLETKQFVRLQVQPAP